MVKRPLLLVLTAFIIGSLLYEVPMILAVGVGVILMAAVVAFLIKISKNRHDQILLIVPVFLFLGYVLMKNQSVPGPIDSMIPNTESVSISLSGKIHSIQTSSSSYKILLKNVQYEHAEGQSDYVLVYAKDVTGYAIGNTLLVTGDLSKFQKPTNEYQFDEALYYKNQNIDYKVMAKKCSITDDSINYLSNALYQLRLRFLSALDSISDEEVKTSLAAMLFGEKSMMDKETKVLYEMGGIAHIISISGLHVALIGMAVFTLLQNIAGLKSGVIGAIFFIFCYGILTNFSVSTNRAVIMLILFLLAKIAGRTYDIITAVSLSGLLILVRQPMQVYQCGFLLSYGAVLGIAVIYPCFLQVVDLEALKKGKEWDKKDRGKLSSMFRKWYLYLRYYIVTSFLIQAAIMIVTLPILLYFYYKIATYSFLLNLIVLPLMSYVVLFGLIGTVAACFSLSVGSFLLAPAIYVIKLYLFLCRLVEKLPARILILGRPGNIKLFLYLILAAIGCYALYKRYRSGLIVMILGVLVFFIPSFSNQLAVTSVDVGQGDCFVFQTPDHHVFLVDGGSSSASDVGKYRILPYLYGSGISHIDEIFATHADKDHISAIEELLDASYHGEIEIGCLIVSNTSFEDENYDKLVQFAKDREVPVQAIERGQSQAFGEVSIECLHPSYNYEPKDANGYSLVLSIQYKEFSMLCTGDLPMEGEEEILKTEKLSSYDVLKVGHHGSKNSSSAEFLQVVHPKIALISCGKNNRYGHPHKELLERLTAVTDTIYQTPQSGMIKIQTDGEYIKVSPYIT